MIELIIRNVLIKSCSHQMCSWKREVISILKTTSWVKRQNHAKSEETNQNISALLPDLGEDGEERKNGKIMLFQKSNFLLCLFYEHVIGTLMQVLMQNIVRTQFSLFPSLD